MGAVPPPVLANPPAAYDGLGWFYDRYWRNLCMKLMPALDRLVLTGLPRGARVLDLCCGTGHLSQCLCRRGLKVTGID
jgi:2-polyprenyl-3-methyl-5-hydroxy-6-metoxy-1,4-benzoquinol methylase